MVPRQLAPNNQNPSFHQRISLVSKHLQPETNRPPTPAATTPSTPVTLNQTRPFATMSTQPEHPTLLIPGPIEFDDAVLQSMSHYRYVPKAILP